MLSAVIRSALGYPAFTVGTITGTPEDRVGRTSGKSVVSPGAMLSSYVRIR